MKGNTSENISAAYFQGVFSCWELYVKEECNSAENEEILAEGAGKDKKTDFYDSRRDIAAGCDWNSGADS